LHVAWTWLELIGCMSLLTGEMTPQGSTSGISWYSWNLLIFRMSDVESIGSGLIAPRIPRLSRGLLSSNHDFHLQPILMFLQKACNTGMA